ncbi:hypothetical protein HMPREF1544_03908, partial [Mucor circinelloides 1006PhL]
CLALKPADGTCSPLAKERLALLVSDIRDTIALSENAGLTVPLLLTQFGLFLPICIEEKFHDIIYTISKVLQISWLRSSRSIWPAQTFVS